MSLAKTCTLGAALLCLTASSLWGQEIKPYFGAGLAAAAFGEDSPCQCTTANLDVAGGVRFNNRWRAGIVTGTAPRVGNPLVVIGLEGGYSILPWRKSTAVGPRLEVRASIAGLLAKNTVSESGYVQRSGGYTHNLDLRWRPWAAKPGRDRGYYLSAGRVVLRERGSTARDGLPLSETILTNVGWRFALGYSL